MDAKVLLIENEAKYLDTIPSVLEGAGISVFTATHADVGISIARNVSPSLILLNLATPGTNGLDVCKTLHSIDSLKRTPILLLTLREGSYDPIYESLYGIVGFIKKPFTPESLIEQVAARLGGQTAEPSLTKPVLEEEAMISHAEPNATGEPADHETFDDLISEFGDEAAPGEELANRPPDAAMETSENFSGRDEAQQDEFLFDEKSFSEALESEGIAPGDVPLVKETRPFFNKSIAPKTVFIAVSIVLGIGIVGIGAFFMLSTDSAPKVENKTSIFESKTVLPKNADVHGIVPDEAGASNAIAASNTPASETMPTASINTPVASVNAPAAKAVSVAPPKPETKPEPKRESKKETKKEFMPAAINETAPAPEEKKASAPLHGFYVQFGAFGSRENARKLAGELKDQDLNVIVKETLTKTGTTLYRVLYRESFSSGKAASAKAGAIEDEYDIDTSTYSE